MRVQLLLVVCLLGTVVTHPINQDHGSHSHVVRRDKREVHGNPIPQQLLGGVLSLRHDEPSQDYEFTFPPETLKGEAAAQEMGQAFVTNNGGAATTGSVGGLSGIGGQNTFPAGVQRQFYKRVENVRYPSHATTLPRRHHGYNNYRPYPNSHSRPEFSRTSTTIFTGPASVLGTGGAGFGNVGGVPGSLGTAGGVPLGTTGFGTVAGTGGAPNVDGVSPIPNYHIEDVFGLHENRRNNLVGAVLR